MKKLGKRLLAIMVIAIIFSSCRKDEPLDRGQKEVYFTSAIQGLLQTRLTGNTFEVGDAIGVFMKESGASLGNATDVNREYVFGTASIFSASGVGEKIYFPEDGDVDFVAYYPYQSDLVSNTYTINVADQSNQGNIDLLYAKEENVSTEGTSNATELTFYHQLSKVEITVSMGLGVNDLDGLTVEFHDFSTTASYNVADQAISGRGNAATIAAKLTTNGNTLAEAILIPEAIADKKIVFTLGGKTFEYLLSSGAVSAYQSGTKYTYNVTLNDEGGLTGMSFEPTGVMEWVDGLAVTADLIAGSGPAPDEDFHIYLLIGQSNMSGRGTLVTNIDAINPRVKLLKQDGIWVTAQHPLHIEVEPSAAGVGPGLAFALKMLEHADPNVTIGLIPTAVGGQPISAFAPGVTNTRTNKSIYDESVKYVNIARTQGVFKGVLFHQGEANNNTTNSWINGVTNLISNFRTVFDNPQLPVVIGEMGRYPGDPDKYQNILSVMPGFVANVPYTALVSSAGLADIGDNTHFNSPSASELGNRYAEKMQELLDPAP